MKENKGTIGENVKEIIVKLNQQNRFFKYHTNTKKRKRESLSIYIVSYVLAKVDDNKGIRYMRRPICIPLLEQKSKLSFCRCIVSFIERLARVSSNIGKRKRCDLRRSTDTYAYDERQTLTKKNRLTDVNRLEDLCIL